MKNLIYAILEEEVENILFNPYEIAKKASLDEVADDKSKVRRKHYSNAEYRSKCSKRISRRKASKKRKHDARKRRVFNNSAMSRANKFESNQKIRKNRRHAKKVIEYGLMEYSSL